MSISEAPGRAVPSNGAVTTADRNKRVVRDWIEAYNERDEQGEAAARTRDYVAHAPGVPVPLDSDAWVQFIAGFAAAMPDLRLTVEDIVGDEELVSARITFRGTQTGPFQGIPPTNRQVEFAAIEINRMAGGKVREHWFQFDQLSLLRQLGVAVGG